MIEVTVSLNAGLRRYRPDLDIGQALPLHIPSGMNLHELLIQILQLITIFVISPELGSFAVVNESILLAL